MGALAEIARHQSPPPVPEERPTNAGLAEDTFDINPGPKPLHHKHRLQFSNEGLSSVDDSLGGSNGNGRERSGRLGRSGRKPFLENLRRGRTGMRSSLYSFANLSLADIRARVKQANVPKHARILTVVGLASTFLLVFLLWSAPPATDDSLHT